MSNVKKCLKCKVQFCIHTALMMAIFELSLYCRVFMKNYVFIFDFVSCILHHREMAFHYQKITFYPEHPVVSSLT